MERAGRDWVRDLTFLLLAFALTLLVQRSAAIQADEGYTLNAAWQLWTGMRMYDDFRLFVGPGSGHAIYFVWRAVGSPSLMAARLFSLALSFSATTGLWLILRRLGVRAAGLAVAIAIWLFSSGLYVVMNHNPFSSFAAVWFLWLFLRAGESGRPRDWALAGAAAGVVVWFLQTKGLLLAGTAGAFALATGWRARRFAPALAVGGGFLAAVAPLFLIWRPAVLLHEWLLVPFAGNYLGHSTGSAGLALGAVVATGLLLVAAVRSGDRALRALAVTQAALVASTLHNMEVSHLAINAFPGIAFVAAALARRTAVAESGPKPGPTLGPVLPMAAIVALVAGLGLTPGGKAFLSASTLYVDLLGRASRTIVVGERVTAAHAVYAGPFLPGFYYLLGKKNPFFVSETIVCNLACQRRLLAELESVKPELALLHYELAASMGYDPNGPVDSYLRERYVRCPGQFRGGLIVRAIDPTWCPPAPPPPPPSAPPPG